MKNILSVSNVNFCHHTMMSTCFIISIAKIGEKNDK